MSFIKFYLETGLHNEKLVNHLSKSEVYIDGERAGVLVSIFDIFALAP